jgi:ORF6N domain
MGFLTDRPDIDNTFRPVCHSVADGRVEGARCLAGVETKRLIQQVRRNLKRFPGDFMFQLSKAEAEALRSQFATSNDGRGGRRYAPYVFTEQGVAMLSGVPRISWSLVTRSRPCSMAVA